MVYINEELPDEWKEGIICPIHKKGDQMVCANYRGISLLNLCYKVLSNVIFDHLLPFVESRMGTYQCGFHFNKSTIDQIFTLCQIVKRTTEFGIGTHHLFLDYKAAYDSIRWEQLYDSMRDLNIPEKLTRMVKAIMSEVKSCIRVKTNL
jgi:sorting nexin-29